MNEAVPVEPLDLIKVKDFQKSAYVIGIGMCGENRVQVSYAQSVQTFSNPCLTAATVYE